MVHELSAGIDKANVEDLNNIIKELVQVCNQGGHVDPSAEDSYVSCLFISIYVVFVVFVFVVSLT